MEIQRVSSTQPTFNGYVGKSVIKYINKAIKNESKNIIKNAKENNTQPDENKLAELHYYGAKILGDLSSYMGKTHKNTHLEMGDTKYYSHPRIKNPVTDHIMRIYSPLTNDQPKIDNFGTISMPKTMTLSPKKIAGKTDLDKLNDISAKLSKIDPKEIDKAFYNVERDNLDEIMEEDLGFWAEIHNTFREGRLINYYDEIK